MSVFTNAGRKCLAGTEPWRPGGVEIRGVAEALPTGGATGQGLGGQISRIHPRPVLGRGLDTGPFATPCARTVGDRTLRDVR